MACLNPGDEVLIDLIIADLETVTDDLSAAVSAAAKEVRVDEIKKAENAIVQQAAEQVLDVPANAPPPVVSATLPPPPPLIIRSLALLPETASINAPPLDGKPDRRFATSVRLFAAVDASDGFQHDVVWEASPPGLVTLATDSFDPNVVVKANPSKRAGQVTITATTREGSPPRSATASVVITNFGAVSARVR
jgi:hypothetical protein